jgi:hypothetical protein
MRARGCSSAGYALMARKVSGGILRGPLEGGDPGPGRMLGARERVRGKPHPSPQPAP